ncbi:cupin domain-containing protein [Neptunicella marina]|uniref:Cupin domain-containing protein n=1 Tax=Neptunicella marina TaxID=2125989 RepID=A0A8J6M6E2_9ALTE|nr:cupin domain-containing protein [Neptunicella marina]MBC3767091.1 cupin domain-containing protein [Neptunicella marina]
MQGYLLKKQQIDQMPGQDKSHYLNPEAQRNNKSLGDLTGLSGLGFHIIRVAPGKWSTETHVHYYEDECAYVLEGTGQVRIGEQLYAIEAGDFIGYRANGLPHNMQNTGNQDLVCIVVGQRLPHEVADYPVLKKRLYKNVSRDWELVDLEQIDYPPRGKVSDQEKS